MEDEARSCLNCGTPLQGRYCHACGQRDQPRRLHLRHVLHDVFHDLWHLDVKLSGTVRLLVTRPGFLAQDYLAGRRVHHVPPFRLYLIVSFVLFLLLSLGGQKTMRFSYGGRPAGTAAQQASGAPGLNVEIPPAAPSNRLEALLERGATRAAADPAKAQAILMQNFPRAMFVLLPLFALLLQVAFWDRGRYFVEHMVFSLHEHTFAFLVFIAMWLVSRIPGTAAGCFGGLLTLAVPVHLGMALKRMYGLGLPRTLLSGLLISGIYLGIVLAVVILTVIVSLAQL